MPIMTLLPIVHRELQVAARRQGTYRARFWLALAMVGLWLLLLRFGQSTLPASQQGQSLFRSSGVLALLFAMVAGAFLTADCLSEEKRDGTLGLLFLTELKGYNVVLGKLIATSLHGFYGLLAVLPLLGLPLLIGSVTGGEFCRIALALTATLFLSLSIGMLVSALWLRSRQTMTWTLVILALVAGLPAGLWWLLCAWQGGLAPQVLLAPSPPYLFWAGLEANYAGAAYWRSLLTVLVLACGALVFPSLYAPRAWRETGEAEEAEPRAWGGWLGLRFGPVRSQPAHRGRLEANPYYWLAGRDLTSQWAAWCLLGPLFGIWACLVMASLALDIRTSASFSALLWAIIVTAYGMHQVLKSLVTIEASRGSARNSAAGQSSRCW